MARPIFYQIAAPDAGLDKFNPATMIADRATPEARNIRFQGGVLFKRLGYRTLTSTSMSAPAILAADFNRLDATNSVMLAATKNLYYWTGTAWSAIKSGLSGQVGGYHSACVLNDTWLYSNGVDPVQKWTGTGNASNLLGGTDYQTPNYHIARSVMTFADRVFLLGPNEDGTSIPQRARWGELGKLEEWNEDEGGGYADLKDDASGLQCGVLMGDWAVLYCGKSIWICTYIGGNVYFRFNRAVPNVGTRAPRTVADLGNEHIFMGEDDIYRFNGSSVTPIGEPIRADLFSAVSRANMSRCFGTLNRSEHLYHLYVPYGSQDGVITRAYVYDYKNGTWGMDTVTQGLTCAATVELGTSLTIDGLDSYAATIDTLQVPTIDALGGFTSRLNKLMADSSGYVYQDDGLTPDDNGVAVDGWWETKDLALHDVYIDNLKRLHSILFEARGDSVTLWYSTDSGETWKRIKIQTLTSDWLRYKADVDFSCRKIRLRFRNNTSGQRFWLRWIGFKGFLGGDR